MPNNPEPEGGARLMTVAEIAERYGVSRQTVHSYRRRGDFPQPVQGEGSTRLRFRAGEVAAFFAKNPKQQGRRTDRARQAQRGDTETMTDDLIAFLRECLDKDAEVARAAAAMPGGVPGEQWRVSGTHADDGGTYWSITTGTPDLVQTVELVGSGMSGGGAHTEEVALHIVRHDPARVLAEIDAKRQIVEDFERADRYSRTTWGQSNADQSRARTMGKVVRLLALPYADHPDYREEWRP